MKKLTGSFSVICFVHIGDLHCCFQNIISLIIRKLFSSAKS
jgi:hypothetical protein